MQHLFFPSSGASSLHKKIRESRSTMSWGGYHLQFYFHRDFVIGFGVFGFSVLEHVYFLFWRRKALFPLSFLLCSFFSSSKSTSFSFPFANPYFIVGCWFSPFFLGRREESGHMCGLLCILLWFLRLSKILYFSFALPDI